MLLEETPFFFHPKLEIPFCNACFAEPNIRDQTQLSYHFTLEGGGIWVISKNIYPADWFRGEKMTCKEIPWEKISCIEKKKTLNIMLVVNNTLACGFYFHTSSWWSLRENRGERCFFLCAFLFQLINWQKGCKHSFYYSPFSPRP